MIRFCDKEVFYIRKSEISRGKLITHFCQKGCANDIIMIYDEDGKWIGITYYELVLYSSIEKVEGLIETEHLLVGENIFIDAKRIFELHPEKIWLIIFNKNNEPECFAFNDKQRNSYNDIDIILTNLEKNAYSGVQELYPQLQEVHIFDCNEWAYRVYNIFRKEKISLKIYGTKWDIVGEVADTGFGSKETYPDYEILSIYAEGTEYFKERKEKNGNKFSNIKLYFDFLKYLALLNGYKTVESFKNESASNLYICKIPSFQSLSTFSAQEYFWRYVAVGTADSKSTNHQLDKKLNKILGMSHYEYKRKKKEEIQWKIYRRNEPSGFVLKPSKNIIYVIGSCIAYGYGCLWEWTLFSQLQYHLDKMYDNYAICTIGYNEWDGSQLTKIMKSLPITSKDIIIFINRELGDELEQSPISNADLELTDLFNNRPEDEIWYYDIPIHTTPSGNKAVAEEIFNKLISPTIHSLRNSKEYWIQKGEILSEGNREKLDSYIKDIQEKTMDIPKTAKIGAIVMNCNPFTLGHQYLVEQASSQVDYLYIFVVQENLSAFPFEDRIEMVRSGVKSFQNVRVFYSGEFILSYYTMPAYFQKESLQDAKIDASKDIEIFSRYIAPELNISIRFVGEEPTDKITEQYNQEMRKTLCRYGIDFMEIPRIELEDKPISASLVRKFMYEKNWGEISKLVPQSTLRYLKNGKDIPCQP